MAESPEEILENGFDRLNHSIDRLLAERDALKAVVRSVVLEYEATFVDPEEMSGEWKEIYDQARAALKASI